MKNDGVFQALDTELNLNDNLFLEGKWPCVMAAIVGSTKTVKESQGMSLKMVALNGIVHHAKPAKNNMFM